jgi:hypothetical protein
MLPVGVVPDVAATVAVSNTLDPYAAVVGDAVRLVEVVVRGLTVTEMALEVDAVKELSPA